MRFRPQKRNAFLHLLQEGLAFIFIFPEGIIPAADNPSNGDGKQIIFLIGAVGRSGVQRVDGVVGDYRFRFAVV